MRATIKKGRAPSYYCGLLASQANKEKGEQNTKKNREGKREPEVHAAWV
jgi:hypothetical protein